jgi:heat shock protein HslJ
MFSKAGNWMNRNLKSGRLNYALVFSLLVLLVAIGVASASGPMRPPGPPMGGMWGRPMPWMPMEPVPTITIVAVVKDQSVTFETGNFPAEQDFTVTMGRIYSRGVGGYEVGTFNSGDGSAQQLSFPIPEELAGQYRIAVRAQTSHPRPYFAFNWFYNNTTGETAVPVTSEAETPAAEAEAPAAEGEAPAAEAEAGTGGAEEAVTEPSLTGVAWQWTNFTDPEQGALPIDSPEQYVIEFTPEGRVGIKADCNNGTGTYIVDEGSIDIALGAMTLALCAPESLSDQFLNYLGDVSAYTFDGNDLLLDLPDGAGTMRFAVAGAAVEESADTPPAAAEPPAEEAAPAEVSLTGVVWEWIGFTDPVDEPLVIADPAQYTVEFMADGTVAAKADCNNGAGSYTAAEGSISITIGAMTMALCPPESYSDQFVEYLNAVAVYSFIEGDLLLDLPIDSGTLRFQAAAAETAQANTAVAATAAAAAEDMVQTVAMPATMAEETVPSFKICSVVKDATVTIVTEDFPAGETFAVKMGPLPAQQMAMGPMRPMPRPMPPMGGPGMGRQMPMRPSGMWGQPMQPKVWIPYYEAGTLESGEGGSLTATFDIPAELAGTYRVSIMLRTEHQYPYLAYNWFYNNTADVCNGSD